MHIYGKARLLEKGQEQSNTPEGGGDCDTPSPLFTISYFLYLTPLTFDPQLFNWVL